MKKLDISGARYAPFAVPELRSRAFLDALFKMPRAYLDATPKGADYFAPFAVPEFGSRAYPDALFKMPRAYLDATPKGVAAYSFELK